MSDWLMDFTLRFRSQLCGLGKILQGLDSWSVKWRRAHTELFFAFFFFCGGTNLYVDYLIWLSLQTYKAGTIVISIWQTKALKLRELKNLLQVTQLINMYLVVVLVIKWDKAY